METKKIQAPAFIFAAVIIALSFIQPIPAACGLTASSTIVARLTYHFFHSSVFHAAINLLCLYAITFKYQAPAWHFIVAFIMASIAPTFALSPTPTVGLSGICFTLIGLQTFLVQRKIFFASYILTFLLISALLPFVLIACGLNSTQPNTPLHLYCYVAGTILSFITAPLWKK